MDHWSFVFIICFSGMLIYSGLGLIWVIQYHWGTLASRTFVRNNAKGLMLATGSCAIVAGVLATLDHFGYIAMWEIRYALIQLHLQ